MKDLVISGARIVTLDPAVGDLPRGDILVRGGRIAAIAPAIPAEGLPRLDASGHVALPGLINAHVHGWQSLLRGIGGDWTGRDYDDILHNALAPLYTPEDLHTATLFSALSQLDGGVTTVFDWCHNNPTPAHSDAAVAALTEAGVRAVFGHGSAKPDHAPGRPHFSTVPHDWAELERLMAAHPHGEGSLLTFAACLLGPDYGTYEVCREDFARARDLGVLTSAHVWGTPGRKTPGGYLRLAAEGLVPEGHNIVHGNYLDEDEFAALFDAGASFTSAPGVEMRAHVREPLFMRVHRRGGLPSLGVDCEALASPSMTGAMRFALQIHRLMDTMGKVAALRGSGDPAPDAGGSIVRQVALRSAEVLDWATRGNARALGLGHRIGTLSPGKEADILLLGGAGLAIPPMGSPAEFLIQNCQNQDIRTVLVAGRVVKRDGRLLHPRAQTLLAEASEGAARLISALPEVLRARCSMSRIGT